MSASFQSVIRADAYCPELSKQMSDSMASACTNLFVSPLLPPRGGYLSRPTILRARRNAITFSAKDSRVFILITATDSCQNINSERNNKIISSQRSNFCCPIRFRVGRDVAKPALCFAKNNKLPEEEDREYDSGHTASTKPGDSTEWAILERWNVPWDGKLVAITTTGFGASFLLTGLTLSLVVAGLGFGKRQLLDLDEQAYLTFANQLLQTFLGIAVINFCINRYKPLPKDLFSYDWRNPFDLERGWVLWGGVGVVGGAAAVIFAGMITSSFNGQPLPREEQDALLQLLPLIGFSNTSTTLLVAVTGILAPYLEETFFRGFLMTSLTKWVPTPVAVLLSATSFALAHFTPREIPQLFALGVVLGFAYAQTRNLLTPIMIHAFWNSGVIILLTILRLQGYDLQELI